MRKTKRNTALCLILMLTMNLHGQQVISVSHFDSVYNSVLGGLNTDSGGSVKAFESLLKVRESLTDIQCARLDYLQLRMVETFPMKMAGADHEPCAAPDSLKQPDSLQFCARRYLERSMPDQAIPLLMKSIQQLPAGSGASDHAKIELCEAYRQKQEYSKAMSILYDLLQRQHGLTDRNRAYAWNRLAALYNESSKPASGYTDSVMRYSLLCLNQSEKNGDTVNLATAQNELSYQYILHKEFKKALDLSEKSATNFRASGMPFQAMNALINQSIIYMKLRDNRNALRTLHDASKMAPLWENRNMYLRIYRQYASVYAAIGDYQSAYEFVLLCNQLQLDFYKDRMNSQIVEQSARFDLYVKEQQIRDEQKKNEYTHRQILLLIIIIIAIVLAFLFIIFYFRLKRKDVMKQKLIEAVVETENNERRRIARDLHDGLGPVLSAINHYFQAYLDAKPDKKEAIQERLQHVITEAIDEVSRISHNISPHVLEKHGLIPALNNLFAPLNTDGRYEIRFDPGTVNRLDPKIELTVYRCITELLNNTLKHAEASKITLGFEQTNEYLCIRYTDNGKGFKAENRRREGMGLSNIANRIESFGGNLSIDSSPNDGITVIITMPV
jgi:signal transduction histidine kinase